MNLNNSEIGLLEQLLTRINLHSEHETGVYKYNISGEMTNEEHFTLKYLMIKLETIR